MHKTLTLAFLAALLAGGCATESARYSASLEVSNAPPPLRVVWVSRPAYAMEFRGVYVVDDDAYQTDCDIFQYSGSWYAYTGGYWYRASSYRGPYVTISVERVPQRIFEVPARHWKHHPHGGPPGQMKKNRRYD
jgi:hypothetical protein